MSDLISRQAAIDAVEELIAIHFDRVVILNKVVVALMNIPSAEPKKGKWVLHDGYYCTLCGYKLVTTAIPDRCPSCMADMR